MGDRDGPAAVPAMTPEDRQLWMHNSLDQVALGLVRNPFSFSLLLSLRCPYASFLPPNTQLREIERTRRLQAEDKKEELRQLVGLRYRALIQTADSIVEMKQLVESTGACVRVRSCGCARVGRRPNCPPRWRVEVPRSCAGAAGFVCVCSDARASARSPSQA